MQKYLQQELIFTSPNRPVLLFLFGFLGVALFANFAGFGGLDAAFVAALQTGFHGSFAATFLGRSFIGGETDGAEQEE